MPITKSAKKRVRQEKIRNTRNKIISLNARKKIKKLLEFIAKKDKKKSQELFRICQKALAKVGNKGILKNSRYIIISSRNLTRYDRRSLETLII